MGVKTKNNKANIFDILLIYLSIYTYEIVLLILYYFIILFIAHNNIE